MSKLLEFLFGEYVNSPYILNNMHLILSLGFTLMVSCFMIQVYRSIHNSLSYNKKFAVTLVMLAFVSTVLLALVQNNPLLSLGVLGSLSICRIRTNTRDPRDIGFVFWALAIGISSAVGAFAIGTLSSAILGVVLYCTYNFRKKSHSLLMIIRGKKDQLVAVQNHLHKACKNTIQSKNVFSDSFELVYELYVQDHEEESLIDEISRIDGIYGVNILAPETKVV